MHLLERKGFVANEARNRRMKASPSLTALALYFLKLGATGFGGPVALANYMRKDLVESAGWLTEEEYERGLAIATACPGPLAYQLGVYCGYIRHGVTGGIVIGFAFALAPFLIVTAVAALYTHYSASTIVRSLFYGVGPVVVALILKACLNLGLKTLKREYAAWIIAGIALVVTILVQRELVVLILLSGALGIFLFAPALRAAAKETRPSSEPPKPLRADAALLLATTFPAFINTPAFQLFAFFFRTGFLVFGSGLVVVSFVKAFVVDQYHWMDERAFLDAVSVGIVSPGPVVITATFVGYVVAGFGGALAATVGIFLPSILFTVAGTPLLLRYRDNRRVMGFVRGVTVAVVGVLAGTAYLVAVPIVVDWLTAIVLVLALLAPRLGLKKLPDQVLVAAGAVIGLVAYPLLHAAPPH
jgi:chromate transporter